MLRAASLRRCQCATLDITAAVGKFDTHILY